jgi:hypothetical protein
MGNKISVKYSHSIFTEKEELEHNYINAAENGFTFDNKITFADPTMNRFKNHEKLGILGNEERKEDFIA